MCCSLTRSILPFFHYYYYDPLFLLITYLLFFLLCENSTENSTMNDLFLPSILPLLFRVCAKRRGCTTPPSPLFLETCNVRRPLVLPKCAGKRSQKSLDVCCRSSSVYYLTVILIIGPAFPFRTPCCGSESSNAKDDPAEATANDREIQEKRRKNQVESNDTRAMRDERLKAHSLTKEEKKTLCSPEFCLSCL